MEIVIGSLLAVRGKELVFPPADRKIYLVDSEGNFLVDHEGNYLICGEIKKTTNV